MIPYVNSSFGVRILLRFHGSALWKSALPALISTIIYLGLYFSLHLQESNLNDIFLHPYPMQALVTAFTFLLVFRANYSYNRWWEAYTAVYLMHSKWLDLATEVAAFHYQSKRYDAFKPPSFGANPDVQSLGILQSESLRSNRAEFDLDNNIGRGSTGRTGEDSFIRSISITPSTIRQTRQNIISPRGLSRHSKKPTIIDLIKQMDDCEAEEAEMKQRLANEMDSDRTDGDVDENENENESNEIYSGQSIYTDEEGGVAVPRKRHRSWLRKIRDKHFEARTERRTKKLDEHRRQADAILTNKTEVVNVNRFSTNPSAPRRQKTSKTKRMTRHRNRHTVANPQTTTGQLFRRKSIARSNASAIRENRQLEYRDRYDETSGKPYSIFTAISRKHLRAGHLDPDSIPPLLFLEECAHLLSLMSAVAFSTLRNDLPEAESPLTAFEPGLPWPQVDPDNYKGKVRKGWTQSKYRSYGVLQFILGRSRNDNARTLYNAARPFRVIGNVSDNEIEKLQEARGPLAKVTLVSMWLLELISREYQAGSTGDVAAPIISRLYQFVSEGLAGYNQARKIAYIPFPFPHAQITTLFMLIVDFFVTPLLMATYVTQPYLGFFLNLFSVMCFTGLHEVAREIENPFQNVPNDVPLNNYQAQFNEGLMVMFYGYHPDAYWKSGSDSPNQDKSSSPNSSGVPKNDTERNQRQSEGKNAFGGDIGKFGGNEYPQNERITFPSQQQQLSVSSQSPRIDNNLDNELEPKVNVHSNTQIPEDSVLQTEPQRNDLFHVPTGTSVRQEGSTMNTRNSEDVNRISDASTVVGNMHSTVSFNNEKTENFLRYALSGSMGTSSGSFRMAQYGNDSLREIETDGIEQPHHSVQFRIPSRTSESSTESRIPQNQVSSSQGYQKPIDGAEKKKPQGSLPMN